MNRSSPPHYSRGWVFLLAITVAVVLGTFGYVQTLPAKYTSVAVVTLIPKGSRPVNAAVVILTAPRYVAYATSPYVLREVADAQDMESHELSDAVVVTMAAATANISISVTLSDPERAAAVANTLGQAILRRAGADPILAAQLISSAVAPKDPSGPQRTAILAAGLIAGLVAGIAAAVAVERYHRRRAAVVARGVATVDSAVDVVSSVPSPRPDDTVALEAPVELAGPVARPPAADDTVVLRIDPAIFESDVPPTADNEDEARDPVEGTGDGENAAADEDTESASDTEDPTSEVPTVEKASDAEPETPDEKPRAVKRSRVRSAAKPR